MIPKHTVTIFLLQLLLISTTPRAQEQGPWWTWPTIDGNWFGYRHTLADYGLVFSGTTVVDLQGNASGGESRGFAAADASFVALDADLEKLAGIKGFLLHAEFVANAGQNLSEKNIGNVLQVGTAFSQPGYYLGQMYAQQKLFNGKLTLQVGRMTTANNFASLPVFADYVSFADNPIPVSLTDNNIYFTSLPRLNGQASELSHPLDHSRLRLESTGPIYLPDSPSPRDTDWISRSREAAVRWKSVS
jgi:carbohydrate-selective porin OprB